MKKLMIILITILSLTFLSACTREQSQLDEKNGNIEYIDINTEELRSYIDLTKEQYTFSKGTMGTTNTGERWVKKDSEFTFKYNQEDFLSIKLRVLGVKRLKDQKLNLSIKLDGETIKNYFIKKDGEYTKNIEIKNKPKEEIATISLHADQEFVTTEKGQPNTKGLSFLISEIGFE